MLDLQKRTFHFLVILIRLQSVLATEKYDAFIWPLKKFQNWGKKVRVCKSVYLAGLINPSMLLCTYGPYDYKSQRKDIVMFDCYSWGSSCGNVVYCFLINIPK